MNKNSDVYIERFWTYVCIRKKDQCWNWLGAKMLNGYGKFRVGDKNLLAHRYSFSINNKAIPNGLFVLHVCDNRTCVNPNHLFLGTSQDNADDMIRKGRHVGQPPGEFHSLCKFSDEKIRLIRKELKGINFYGKRRAIINKYGISRSYLCEISKFRYRVEPKGYRKKGICSKFKPNSCSLTSSTVTTS